MSVVALEALTFGLARMARAAEEVGHRLCLLTGDRRVYRHELSAMAPDALDVVDVDTGDPAAVRRALSGMPRPSGLINTTDTWSEAAASLAAELGLPGPGPESVALLRDKARVREVLHRAGIDPSPGTVVPAGPAGEAPVLAEVGLPAVLKDSAGTSSRAVWIARDVDGLRDALREAAACGLRGRLLAEPFLAGPLYSAETLSWKGTTRLLGVLSRHLSRDPSVREEAASFPVALGTETLAAVETWVARVLAAAGHEEGFAHVEFVLTADGPRLVEINRRIGGALVAEALCRTLRTNVYTAMIDCALGRRPALLDAPLEASGPAVAFVLVHADEPGVLEGWTGLEGLSAYPGNVEWFPTRAPGDVLEHTGDQRGCTGLVLAEAATAELAQHRAWSAAVSVRPRLRKR